ncbi:DoxX family protein [Sorangium sp. So ce302]|uniref:DoxX family protein n=1 Tax=Sorangium sp. So ce302 TaxID=3133297 RepID=UPI003F602D33
MLSRKRADAGAHFFKEMMAMKKDRYIYWATTGLIAALMLWSSYNFAFNEEQRDAFRHLGLPDWFRVELTVAKGLGALALLIPVVPSKVKDFAYFGFGLTFVSADIAHLSSGDSRWLILPHWTFFGILVVSYLYHHKLERTRAAELLLGTCAGSLNGRPA